MIKLRSEVVAEMCVKALDQCVQLNRAMPPGVKDGFIDTGYNKEIHMLNDLLYKSRMDIVVFLTNSDISVFKHIESAIEFLQKEV